MANLEITNNDVTGVVVWEPVFENETLLDAGGATYAAGTLLGRITASGKLTAYVVGAVDGSEVPVAVLRDELVLVAATDTACRPIIAGRVRIADLVAHGVGAITIAESDALRDYGIIPLTTTQLSELDNQ
tara:strand:- start:34078 stop:34467 length:390 start_codon:yes stop_codon:yes gene_type:complete